MSERDKLHTGELFLPMDPTVLEEQLVRMDLLWEYNQLKPSRQAERAALLQKMLGDCGEGVYIEAPFYPWLSIKVNLRKISPVMVYIPT